jgi:hypothetical protein
MRSSSSRRAGHACDGQLRGRPPEELVGRERHRSARVLDDDLRHRKVELALDDKRDRSVRDRLRREVVAVCPLAGHCEEERPGRRGARVVGEIANVGRRRTGDVHRRKRGDQPPQVHDERV